MSHLENKPFGIIYKVVNLVNGKIYIGKTVKNLDIRKTQHINSSNNKNNLNYNCIFYRAIRKYGEYNFNWEIIDYGYNDIELSDKEIYWINCFNSYIHSDNSNGYNMTTGGEGTSGHKMSKRNKEKLSKIAKEKFSGSGNPMFGKTHSKLSISKNSKNQPSRKEVLQFSANGDLIMEYQSLSEASKNLNINHSSLMRTCRGEQIHSLGFIWIYKEDYNENLLMDRINNFNLNKQKQIVQLDKSFNFLCEYNSATECANTISGDLSSIIKCCKGKLKTHKGFIFLYKDDYERMRF